MSESLVITTEGEFGRGSYPVKISQTVANKIDIIATERQVKVETLINEILEQYVTGQSPSKKQGGAAFLLSLAGMFSSGLGDTSASVRTVVADFITKKQGQSLS
jgi:hypothetical protein